MLLDETDMEKIIVLAKSYRTDAEKRRLLKNLNAALCNMEIIDESDESLIDRLGPIRKAPRSIRNAAGVSGRKAGETKKNMPLP